MLRLTGVLSANMFRCENYEAGSCDTDKCRRCRGRHLFYGGYGARRYGSARLIPGADFYRAIYWKNTTLATREAACRMLQDAALTSVPLLAERDALVSTRMARRFGSGRFTKSHKELAFLIVAWECFLISPFPDDGVSKTRSGQRCAVARHVLKFGRDNALPMATTNFRAMKEVAPLFVAAMLPLTMRIISEYARRERKNTRLYGPDWWKEWFISRQPRKPQRIINLNNDN